MVYDVIIQNGTIFEGSGNCWFRADIGVKDGRIEHIGKLKEASAAQKIDAKKAVVAPGFIDTHSHSDLMLLVEPEAKQKIMQGVTTELLGQDGISCAPLTDEKIRTSMKKRLAGLLGTIDLEWSWNSFGDYLDALEQHRTAPNIASLVPHGSVRASIMQFKDRIPSPGELEAMKHLLSKSMKEGGFGMSTGLVYPPCSYARPEELVELCKVVAEYHGVFVTHIRNESDYLVEALNEVIDVSKKAGVALHVSHFKVYGEANRPKLKDALALVDDARRSGVDITLDVYPYIAGSTMLDGMIPHWAHRGGSEKLLERLQDPANRERIKKNWDGREEIPGWDNWLKWTGWAKIMITWVQSEKNKPLEGKTIAEIAQIVGKDPPEVVFDLLVEEELAVSEVDFWGREEDVATVMKHEASMVATDGLLGGRPHPRVFGTYPRVLGKFVRKDRVLPLREALRKMTAFPAQRFGLQDRGLLREGFAADITIFDPDYVIDTATYQDPLQFPEGIKYVLVNGTVVNEKGRHTGQLPGKILRHQA